MKRMRLMLLIAAGVYCSLMATAKNVVVASPNGLVKADINVGEDLRFSVNVAGDIILDGCRIGLVVEGKTWGEKPQLKKVVRKAVSENIRREVPIKNAIVKNEANEVCLQMASGWAVIFRAYDNGVGYRFVSMKGERETQVDDEILDLPIDRDYQLTMSQCGSFRQNYEERYTHMVAGDYSKDSPMNYLPLYMQTADGYQVLFSETAVEDYPHMFLRGTDEGMKAVFPKVPIEVEQQWDRFLIPTKEADYIAKTDCPRSFPWRFFVISKDARDIVANEMEYVLATPSVIGDTSWIRPGQVSWDWIPNRQLWGVDFKSGCNEETYRYYIDFAAKYGIPYIILDEGWAVSTADPFHSNKDIDLPRLIAYGKERGVRLILWLTWLEVERNFDIFAKYEEWGIGGLKIDFMDRSDQWMVNYYERVCKEAAKHHLLVDFHGSFKPAGLERKYPNLISYEGVLGEEQGGRCKPENTNWIPFIRNAVGPMDFTPGGLLNVQPENNNTTGELAMTSGTRAYQMALYVIFTTGLQMLADSPSRYLENVPCTEFITSVPVLWDETRVLLAEPGKYVVMARRSGNRWFVGGINDNEPRDIEINPDFLSQGEKTLTVFVDGANADRRAIDYKKQEMPVSRSERIKFHMARNGGFAGVIE